MLFENINQFKKAKSLLESQMTTEETFKNLRNDKDFNSISDSDLRSAIEKVQEGFGEKILNAASKMFGGDVSKIDTVLTQMKDQELKFNAEENEIYVEFYNLVEKKKELQKDKYNPNYKEMMTEINQSMNSLNVRMNELTKSHEKIFSALEEKIKSLTGESNRKKKYFNAKRASDVLETQTDRYEKIKNLTKKSTERANSLEKFFGVSTGELEKEVEEAEKNANKNLSNVTPEEASKANLVQDPEKGFFEKFELIKNSNQENSKKRWAIKDIISDVEKIIHSTDFDTYEDTRQKAIVKFYMDMEKEVEKIEKKANKL
jgi:hypothetical protein